MSLPLILLIILSANPTFLHAEDLPFFSLPIFELLAANTNLYAAKHDANGIHQTGRYAGKKKRLWRDTSAGELPLLVHASFRD